MTVIPTLATSPGNQTDPEACMPGEFSCGNNNVHLPVGSRRVGCCQQYSRFWQRCVYGRLLYRLEAVRLRGF